MPMQHSSAASTAAGRAVPDERQPAQQRIIGAALTLFAGKGFAATGIREIADAASLSTATLYHYMGTKEDLLVHIMQEGLRRFISAARTSAVDVTDPERQLVSLTRVHVVTEALEREMSLVIDNEIRALSPEATQVVLPLRDEYEQLWDTAIALGVDNGTFHVGEPRLAQLALLEMCNGVAHWYSAGGRLSLDQVADHFADMALALVDARMDHQRINASTLRMHPASHEVETVRASFTGFRVTIQVPRGVAP